MLFGRSSSNANADSAAAAESSSSDWNSAVIVIVRLPYADALTRSPSTSIVDDFA
jgi:hypothetical protein